MRSRMQAVFQNVSGSLDPRQNVGNIVSEPLRVHQKLDGTSCLRRAAELMELVGLHDYHLDRFPYELSGGQRQRVALARALAVNPSLVVLDEAVSALDVSTRAQVINLLQDLRERLGLAYLFIAHDLSVVHHLCDRVAVMYLGEIVESGGSDLVYSRPRHPYTEALLSAIPRIEAGGRQRIFLEGELPSNTRLPSGCRFHSRCRYAMPLCSEVRPPVTVWPDGGTSACHLHSEGPRLQGASVSTLNAPGAAAAAG
jgi:oligopeptide/dipeptide ABC transporter ATP-binding protein